MMTISCTYIILDVFGLFAQRKPLVVHTLFIIELSSLSARTCSYGCHSLMADVYYHLMQRVKPAIWRGLASAIRKICYKVYGYIPLNSYTPRI